MSERVERVTPYSRMVKRTVVNGVRSVFTNAFSEQQLRSLRITTEYPTAKAQYPSVVIRFQEGSNVNAGVGHTELFRDTDDVLREWSHRLFDGALTFEVHALTSVDRDILGDAIVEMLAFSRMPEMSLQHNLFTYIYGDPEDPDAPDIRSLLSHITYNSDVISAGGESANPVVWGSENDLSYEKSYSVDIWGGYYNSIPSSSTGVDYITHAFVYPHIVDAVELPVWTDANDWMAEMDDGAQDAIDIEVTAQIEATDAFS